MGCGASTAAPPEEEGWPRQGSMGEGLAKIIDENHEAATGEAAPSKPAAAPEEPEPAAQDEPPPQPAQPMGAGLASIIDENKSGCLAESTPRLKYIIIELQKLKYSSRTIAIFML